MEHVPGTQIYYREPRNGTVYRAGGVEYTSPTSGEREILHTLFPTEGWGGTSSEISDDVTTITTVVSTTVAETTVVDTAAVAGDVSQASHEIDEAGAEVLTLSRWLVEVAKHLLPEGVSRAEFLEAFPPERTADLIRGGYLAFNASQTSDTHGPVSESDEVDLRVAVDQLRDTLGGSGRRDTSRKG